MAIIDTTAVINGVRLAEQSANPAIPAAGYQVMYTTTSGIYTRKSSGTVNLVGGGATPATVLNDYILIVDQKAQNTQGGTFTNGAWRTRDLNTIVSDSGGHASVGSNQITLAAGTYIIRAAAPAINVAQHIAKLYNITDAADVIFGTSEVTQPAGTPVTYVSTCSIIRGKFTIASSKVFEIQHQCTNTTATFGFGTAVNLSVEKYTVVELWKVA